MEKINKAIHTLFFLLLKSIKYFLYRLKNAILKFTRRNKQGQMAIRDRFEDIKSLIEKENPLIVDAGAHLGSVTTIFLKLFECPTIHAVEPNPDLAHRLKEKFVGYKNIFVHEKALGSKNKKIEMNILNFSPASSVYSASDISVEYFGNKMNVDHVVEINLVRLDSLIVDKEIDILKLDLQGYELEALFGSEGLLENIKLITIEIEFVPIYNDQPLFGEIDMYLRGKGFQLYNLYELFTHPNGQLIFGDAIYLNSMFLGADTE